MFRIARSDQAFAQFPREPPVFRAIVCGPAQQPHAQVQGGQSEGEVLVRPSFGDDFGQQT